MLCFIKEVKFCEEIFKDLKFVVGFILAYKFTNTVPIRLGRGKLYGIGFLTITVKLSNERFRKIGYSF